LLGHGLLGDFPLVALLAFHLERGLLVVEELNLFGIFTMICWMNH
jgi:hypothetical protein